MTGFKGTLGSLLSYALLQKEGQADEKNRTEELGLRGTAHRERNGFKKKTRKQKILHYSQRAKNPLIPREGSLPHYTSDNTKTWK